MEDIFTYKIENIEITDEMDPEYRSGTETLELTEEKMEDPESE